jgi:hypothetical protein
MIACSDRNRARNCCAIDLDGDPGFGLARPSRTTIIDNHGTMLMSAEVQDDVREKITKLLAGGLKTKTEPFPENDKQFAEILNELREILPENIEKKLVIAGFVDHPFGEDQYRCMECMYYLVHRKWCDLPELAVPVEPEWWCRLWRI